jgi:hypothetical protein
VHANHIVGAMVSVLALSAVDPSIKPCTKDYQIGIFCFKQLQGGRVEVAQNQGYVSEWSDMSIYRLLF